MSRLGHTCRLILGFLILLVTSEVTGQNIELKDNGYENLLIAISDIVEEDWAIVDAIKVHMERASAVLFRSTKYRAYFKEYTILVPDSWNIAGRPVVQQATCERFTAADIRIDVSNPALPDNPYVLGYNICGREGLYMHLTPAYMTDTTVQNRFGGYNDVGKTIIHEWGHLRYGLKDEYGFRNKAKYPLFYLNGGKISPTRCGLLMGGWIVGSTCTMIGTNGLPPNDGSCYFRSDQTQTTVSSSIMFKQFLNNVHDFCDRDTSDLATYHNAMAPNSHNTICQHKSCWEVMREHDDFKSPHSTPIVNPAAQSTVPTCTIVQARPTRVVLVLDMSGSMMAYLTGSLKTRLEKLIGVSTTYITSIVPDGSYVGIVTFGSSATVKSPLVLVNGMSRAALVNVLPTVASGGTCIGCGLEKAIQVLEAHSAPEGGIILLISDGEENVAPLIEDVKQNISSKKILAFTNLITDAASNQLIRLASDTGGSAHFYSGQANDTSLLAFFDLIHGQAGAGSIAGSGRVSVFLDSFTLPAGGVINTNFVLDDTLGPDTVIQSSLTTSNVIVEVTAPNGIVYSSTNMDFLSNTSNLLQLVIPGVAQAGVWSVKLASSMEQTLTVFVSSGKLVAGGATYLLQGHLSHNVISGTDFDSLALAVYAGIFYGYAPVINATVTMEVRRYAVEWTSTLRDTGTGADVDADDGFYSAYTRAYDDDGMYQVLFKASAGRNQAYYYQTTYGDSATGNAASPDFDSGVTESRTRVYLGAFSRFIAGGLYTVDNYALIEAAGDVLAPSRVTDLTVMAIDSENSIVTLNWTAVGDDLDNGRADLYELRYCSTDREAMDEFLTCTVITQAQSPGSFYPSPAFTMEQFVWLVPSALRDVSLIVGVRVMDDANHWSEVSNLVSVIIQENPEYEFPVVTPSPSPGPVTPSPSPGPVTPSPSPGPGGDGGDGGGNGEEGSGSPFGSYTAAIIAPPVVITATIVIIIIVCVCLRYRKVRKPRLGPWDEESRGYDNSSFNGPRYRPTLAWPQWNADRHRGYDYWRRPESVYRPGSVYSRAYREYEDIYDRSYRRPTFSREWY